MRTRKKRDRGKGRRGRGEGPGKCWGFFQFWGLNLVRIKYSIIGPAQEILYSYTPLCVSIHVCAWQEGGRHTAVCACACVWQPEAIAGCPFQFLNSLFSQMVSHWPSLTDSPVLAGPPGLRGPSVYPLQHRHYRRGNQLMSSRLNDTHCINVAIPPTLTYIILF